MIGFRADTGVSSALSDWLDLARGLAAVEVMAFHSYQLMFMEQLPDRHDGPMALLYSVLWGLSSHGEAAVMVFFVLSGYLVGGPALVRSLQGRLSGVDYFSARASRLYVVTVPALVVSLGVYLLAKGSGGWQPYVDSHQALYDSTIFSAPVTATTALCNGLFLQTIACPELAGNMALWSLSNEFWYYVLFFALVSVRRWPAMLLLIVAICGLFMVAERFDALGNHTGLKFFFFFVIWCFGVATYAVQAPGWMWGAGFVGSVAAIGALASRGLMPHWAEISLLVGLCTAASIVCIEHLNLAMPSCLRGGRHLAKISFSLYAIHYPILLLLNVTLTHGARDFTLASVGLEAGFMLVCLVAASVFYFLFESRTPAARSLLKALLSRGWSQGNRLLRRARG